MSKHGLTFPQKGVSLFRHIIAVFQIYATLYAASKHAVHGYLLSDANAYFSLIWGVFAKFNPNNLGNWSIKDTFPTAIAAQKERELVYQMIDLYQASAMSLEGYVTSGSTEGNIYIAWMGRNMLQTHIKDSHKITMLCTNLSHYSVHKAANILAIGVTIIPLDPKTWSMSTESLLAVILAKYKSGTRGFLLPLTIGYTVTGTSDAVAKVCMVLIKIQRTHPDIQFFCWVDAALAGMTKPFTQEGFTPFSQPLIQAVVTDFHKSLQVPIPAGMVLYRTHLRKYVERKIEYLSQDDSTLLGSRTGVAPLVVWLAIYKKGYEGIQKTLATALHRKKEFIREVSQYPQVIKILNDQNNVQCAVVVNRSLPTQFERKYGIHMDTYPIVFSSGKKKVKIYKGYFVK